MNTKIHLVKLPVHIALSVPAKNKPRKGWELTDPSFRHRAVMALFPDTDSPLPRKSVDILFRFEQLAGQPPFFLIQSTVAPKQVDNLDSEVQHRTVSLRRFSPKSAVRFRISINGIRRQTTEHNGRKRITTSPVPFDSDEKAPSHITRMTPWVQKKLNGALRNVEILNHQREVIGTKHRGGKAASMTIQIDTVDGFGIVEDPELLNELILHGVGRAKAYGCGLLSVSEI
ncbi:CRISPR-associated protein [Corynebacterium diphtheriae HC01]|uniref:Type I-E CRISPR-associated protein Cas6/Cse3/CasE n=1 Tax=Corynebacterium diphtheriae (strain ATCC 700971 / NCTC 13129 / Biotype gravis) TaxID=257309 RepID=Q6NEQ5_CORDI|nr:type I-E CRISPR-associated protein Cas6/Cse3/CasE [Corynebacterium diphtheriae]AEX45153.1 CRISPR-associated protein [Corynebacterium diphtheriae 241]AEX75343.1 CRISPR-associated protein [Corynebacterium diphtheriae HC01]ARB88242.1 type I-E CRISPR-associated protein Cas6/Cse3/CasE [Corynebacterium diphtheriae]KKA81105.1 CRISPR-associated protein [Corynebacterium diphtheriae]MBG9270540.1 type I-E CRISPR-associated protein Cas6/Cse3/CasE [Corynebacterium diphtheriae bv. gravis]